MVVRIRFATGPKLGKKRRTNKRLALAVAAMLPPTAFTAGALALWRIAADLNWTSSFAISTGILSHWQVWLACAIAIQLCARALNRYGRSGDSTAQSEV
jgi:hypothetical protein